MSDEMDHTADFCAVTPMFLQLVAKGNNSYNVIQYNYWQKTIQEMEF